MSSFIRDYAAGTPEILAAFGDESVIRHALAFEAALARASAAEGLIDGPTAEAIATACAALKPAPEALAREAAHAGTLAIPLVAMLRKSISDSKVAAAVHSGATSQDVADTALVLQAKDGAALLEREIARLLTALRALCAQHAKTPMLGRTLMQPALPITFGLKCAQWLWALREDRSRLRAACVPALVLQLGGPVGTRNGFKGRGEAVAKHMAAALGLGHAALPWHTRRGNMIALANAVALVVASLGKIAGDIALMAQGEIGELAEPVVPGRGGSSAMAHKRNPTGCRVALSAANRVPGLIAGLLACAANEHERGLGGWQAEAPMIADVFVLAHGALSNMSTVVEGLEINTDAMRKNLERSGVGGDTGEAQAMVAQALSAGDA